MGGELNKKIDDIVESGKAFSLPSWENLPSLPLYMDQIIMYFDAELATLKQNEDEQIITKSMVNNYVKDEILRHPENKRYEKDQIAALITISVLKQVISIGDTKSLVGVSDTEKAYAVFKDAHDSAMHEMAEVLENRKDDDLLETAVSLVAKASAARWAARKLLGEITTGTAKKK